MELVVVLRRLWRMRMAVAAVAAVAFFVALMSVYHVSAKPPFLKAKSLEVGAASTQLLVDSPRSSLAGLDRTQPDLTPLATRAAVFARFMSSAPVEQEIARLVGVPVGRITIAAPVNPGGPEAAQQPPSERRANELVARYRQYRLLVQAEPDLPIVSVFAQAPTAKGAELIANGAVIGLKHYLEKVSAEQRIPEAAQIDVRQLGRARGSLVNAGASKVIALLAFLGTLLLGCVMLLVADSALRARRSQAMDAGAYDAPLDAYSLGPLVETNGHGSVRREHERVG